MSWVSACSSEAPDSDSIMPDAGSPGPEASEGSHAEGAAVDGGSADVLLTDAANEGGADAHPDVDANASDAGPDADASDVGASDADASGADANLGSCTKDIECITGAFC